MILRRRLGELMPVFAGTMVAMLPMETAPFLISGSIDTAHISVPAAGWIGTGSVGAAAAASMVMPWLLSRLPFRRTMLSLIAIIALAYLALALADSFLAFMALAIFGGAAAGGLLAGMAMVVAGTEDPDRSYGYIYAATGVVFALLLLALPAVGSFIGVPAMFLLIGLVAVGAMPVARLLPAGGRAAHDDTVVHAEPVNLKWIATLLIVMSLAMPLYGGTYGFAERKAVEVGLTSVQAGGVLSLATMLTIVGTLCVAAVGTRFGRTVPTLVVLGLATIAYGLTLSATTPTTFVIGFATFGFMQLAMNSYLFGLASAFDRAGKVAAFLQGYSLAPYALGSGLFASLVGNGPLTSLALPAVLVNVAATLLLLPVLLSLDRVGSGAPLASGGSGL